MASFVVPIPFPVCEHMAATDHLNELQFPSPHQHGGELLYLHADENPRCSTCGHRTRDPQTGQKPGATRSKGPLAIARELPRRMEAMRAR